MSDIEIKFSKIDDHDPRGRIATGTMAINDLSPIQIQSGPWGNGRCDLGNYKTGKLWEPSEILKLPNAASYQHFGFGFFLLLNPQFTTKRSGIGIHPMRGNGTNGCCGVILPDLQAYQSLFTLLLSMISNSTDHSLDITIGGVNGT